MPLTILVFVLGVIILLVAADVLVKQAVAFSTALRLSPLIIGSTVVAVGTSLPELVVSMISAVKGDPGLALGNIIGSNVINIFLILGIAVLLGNIRVGTTKTQRNTWVGLGITLLFGFAHLTNWLPWPGIWLLLAFLGYCMLEIKWGITGRKQEDRKQIQKISRKIVKNCLVTLLFSLTGVIGGGIMVVKSTELISQIFGISTTFFGLTVTAIVTSLPELVVTIISERSGQEKIALGNLLGSNICNLGLIGGLLVFFSGRFDISGVGWGFLLGSTIVTIIIVTLSKGKNISKWAGLGLLGGFFVYLAVLSTYA